jgi:hypothetical protein
MSHVNLRRFQIDTRITPPTLEDFCLSLFDGVPAEVWLLACILRVAAIESGVRAKRRLVC